MGLLMVLVNLCSGFAITAWGELPDADCQAVRDQHDAFAEKLCEATLRSSRAGDLQFAISSLWLNQRTNEGNERLRQAYMEILGDNAVMTPELAATEEVKWKMRLWLRIYYLFHSGSAFSPGRLEQDVEEKFRELFWNYGAGKSTVERAQLKYIWCIQGSENHDMMDLSNAFLALQAVKDHPEYDKRKLPDGHTPDEHCVAWNDYYKLYCLERARNGLFAEVVSPTYGKWFLGELVNMYDFAEDHQLRRQMEMLLHLTWADWAIDQLAGIRGGGRTRVYQGKYSTYGGRDSWRYMGLILIGRGDWIDPSGGQANYVLATTSYHLPNVIIDLALSEAERGEYIYTSLRPAKTVDPVEGAGDRGVSGYWMDGSDPRFVRYDYCTPDFIMGSLWLDPETRYAAINTQNQWQGITFPTHVDARVFPQCVGLKNGKTYGQHLAVQHQNVMLVQKNRRAKQSGDMRVWFYKGMKERLLERDGWVLAQEGEACMAVRPIPRLADSDNQGYTWDDENWLRCIDDFAPVVFVAGRTVKYGTLEGFWTYISSHKFHVQDRILYYSFEDVNGDLAKLKMNLENQDELPQINERSIDLKPERVFDSPYLHSRRGSGVVTIQKGTRVLVLDFHSSTNAGRE